MQNELNLGLPQMGKYKAAEKQFIRLIATEDLDAHVHLQPWRNEYFEHSLINALAEAFPSDGRPIDPEFDFDSRQTAMLFLQRVLYHVNRLKLFWFDPLRSYVNERSPYLENVRDRIEKAWQAWELGQIDLHILKEENVAEGLKSRAAFDVNPPPNEQGFYCQHKMSETGYRKLLEIASLDGLVEASQLSRILGGACHPVQALLTRLMLEEYGAGRMERKHSSYFEAMLKEMKMDSKPEAYFECVPWEVLASINQSFLLSERKAYYLRYIGGLTYFEISVPAAFRPYQAAVERLGLPNAAGAYWTLHIREDERHGPWMLEQAALPLAEMYPKDGWELLLGYDQQSRISARASKAVMRRVKAAEVSHKIFLEDILEAVRR